MLTSELDFDLPQHLIAQTPIEPRDASRLLVMDRVDSSLKHARFYNIGQFLHKGDLLVFNQTRVLAARLKGEKPSGGKAELLLLRKLDATRWRALVGGRKVTELRFANAPILARVIVQSDTDSPEREVEFSEPVEPFLSQIGEAPLPPYIKQRLADAERYQTVYARETGSAAAPTAGLHFTAGLMERLQMQGMGVCFVTLHVGLDTFKPISSDSVEQHAIHSEWCALDAVTADAINKTRAAGGRVIAVGTTSVRVLESEAAARGGTGQVAPFMGDTRLFITPGFQFRTINGMVTNFHLPRSSLLALVGAFAGVQHMREAYQVAIREQYRFFSFGDAMLIV